MDYSGIPKKLIKNSKFENFPTRKKYKKEFFLYFLVIQRNFFYVIANEYDHFEFFWPNLMRKTKLEGRGGSGSSENTNSFSSNPENIFFCRTNFVRSLSDSQQLINYSKMNQKILTLSW